MKKNKMMRAASGLLIATLLTTSVIAGTFAKYTTSADGTDTARVAKWGFGTTTMTLDGLFSNAYKTDGTTAGTSDDATVKTTADKTDIIAPGTNGSAQFGFTYAGDTTAPEVAYTFKVDTTGSKIDDSIKNNTSIVWSLDGAECKAEKNKTSWEVLLDKINALDGNETDNKYAPNTLPTAFGVTGDNSSTGYIHTVSWEWKYDNSNDTADTVMGNADTLAGVTLKITITATQID